MTPVDSAIQGEFVELFGGRFGIYRQPKIAREVPRQTTQFQGIAWSNVAIGLGLLKERIDYVAWKLRT